MLMEGEIHNEKVFRVEVKNIGVQYQKAIKVRIYTNYHYPEIGVTRIIGPLKHNETFPVTVSFSWPEDYCYLDFVCKVDPENEVLETREDNNILEKRVFKIKYENFVLENDSIGLYSGRWIRGARNFDTFLLDPSDGLIVAKPHIVLMDVRFRIVNCSGSRYKIHPRITYIGAGCQPKEHDFGEMWFGAGEDKELYARIQVGICREGNHIHVSMWDGKYIHVDIEFSNGFFEGTCAEGGLYYLSRVRLEFGNHPSTSKILENGGSVTLQKGDWRWVYKDEFAMDFNLRLTLKSCIPYHGYLIFKTVNYDGSVFTVRKGEFELQPEEPVEPVCTIKMKQSPPIYRTALKILDESTGKEIFTGRIICSDSLLNEIGCSPDLHVSSQLPNPIIYPDRPKEDENVTMKCLVGCFDSCPVRGEQWWLDLTIKYHDQVMHSKTWQFKGFPSNIPGLLERTYTFKPIYDGEYIYILSLDADNKNILDNDPSKLTRIGSFEVHQQ